ncbi:MAG: porin [Phenylobacterium zucineum]|nr:MAG: porin [Phenylobacterium zucineum]
MRKLICTCTALATTLASAPAIAADGEGAWTHDIVYTADVMGPVKGGAQKSGRYLDNLDVVLEADLEKLAGWRGATLHVYGLSNSGGRPNDVAQTLQGVDNIEVSKAKVHLYELWIEQDIGDGAASVRAGLYDLNSEFYTTEASDLLIAPPFGIGSELASTGPNGPSIFPLTSIAARVRVGRETGAYVQAAVLSAKASTIDGDDMQLGLDRGAILIAEAGHVGRARVAGGAWTYTARQDDIRDVTPAGDPRRSDAYGVYVLGEGRVAGVEDGSRTSLFARVGVSDGDTTPFSGGWQAGLRWDQVFADRPESAISVGIHQGRLSKKFRANGRDDGLGLGKAESGLEITYSDTIGRLSIQPDLQVIHNPGGEKNRRNAVIAGIRFTVDLD